MLVNRLFLFLKIVFRVMPGLSLEMMDSQGNTNSIE